MLVPERHALILHHLQKNDSASVTTLTRLTGLSESTIRRDLLELSARGTGLRRTHGGVISRRIESSTYEPPAQVAAQLNYAAKQRIGHAAAELLADGDSVLFDSGTTVMEAARATVQRGLAITAITNDLTIAQVLNTARMLHMIVTGGTVRPHSNTLFGSPAEAFLQMVHVDLLFLGAHAISTAGLTESSMEIAQTKKHMVASAKRVILLADQSKFECRSFARICGLADVDVLLTDAAPGQLLADELRQAGVEVRLV